MVYGGHERKTLCFALVKRPPYCLFWKSFRGVQVDPQKPKKKLQKFGQFVPPKPRERQFTHTSGIHPTTGQWAKGSSDVHSSNRATALTQIAIKIAATHLWGGQPQDGEGRCQISNTPRPPTGAYSAPPTLFLALE